jgi:hypothetical protein
MTDIEDATLMLRRKISEKELANALSSAIAVRLMEALFEIDAIFEVAGELPRDIASL